MLVEAGFAMVTGDVSQGVGFGGTFGFERAGKMIEQGGDMVAHLAQRQFVGPGQSLTDCLLPPRHNLAGAGTNRVSDAGERMIFEEIEGHVFNGHCFLQLSIAVAGLKKERARLVYATSVPLELAGAFIFLRPAFHFPGCVEEAPRAAARPWAAKSASMLCRPP